MPSVQTPINVKPADMSIDVHTFDAQIYQIYAYLPYGIDTNEVTTLGPCPRPSTLLCKTLPTDMPTPNQHVTQPNFASHSEASLNTRGRTKTPKGPKNEFSQDLNPVKTSPEDVSLTPSSKNCLLSHTRNLADHGGSHINTLGEGGLFCLVIVLWIFTRVVWKLPVDWKRRLGRKRYDLFGLWSRAPSSPFFPSSDRLCHSLTCQGGWGSAGAA